MTIRQEAYEKIMKLPDDGVRLILAIADEIAKQHGIVEEDVLEIENKKKVFQSMIDRREKSTYPKDFDYEKVMEEVINEKKHAGIPHVDRSTA